MPLQVVVKVTFSLKPCRVSTGTAPLIFTLCTGWGKWLTPCPGRCIHRKWTITHWIEGWVGLMDVLDILETRESICFYQDLNSQVRMLLAISITLLRLLTYYSYLKYGVWGLTLAFGNHIVSYIRATVTRPVTHIYKCGNFGRKESNRAYTPFAAALYSTTMFCCVAE
jgi:hypothetical protein